MDLADLLRTLAAAMTPVGELRLAIPLSISHLGVPWYQALPIAIVGNMLPVLVLVPGLERITTLVRRYPSPVSRALDWWIARVTRTYRGHYQRYGALALVGLVAVPLPFTGAWTGSVVAWAFRVPPRTAIPLIALGVVIAGVTVTLLTQAGIHLSLLIKDGG